MPIYCARQPLWSRGTSGWSQLPSARGSAAEPAERGGSAREAGAQAAPAGHPVPARAGFPAVNRAALREQSRSAECVIERSLSARGQHSALGEKTQALLLLNLNSSKGTDVTLLGRAGLEVPQSPAPAFVFTCSTLW